MHAELFTLGLSTVPDLFQGLINVNYSGKSLGPSLKTLTLTMLNFSIML